MQGFLDMKALTKWNETAKDLSRISKVIENNPYRVVIASSGLKLKDCKAENATCNVEIFDKVNQTIQSKSYADIKWNVTFG